MAKRKRVRIANQVFADRFGIAGIVKVRGVRREQRFPPGHPLDSIQAWQARTRSEILEDREETNAIGTATPVRGTYARDLERYVKLIAGRVSFTSDRAHLRAWLPILGPLSRSLIRPSHVKAAVAQWVAAGVRPQTIRHRARVLRSLYRTLDGAHSRPPTRDVVLPKVAAPSPTPVPVATIQAVAKSLKRGITTRQRPGRLSRATYARFLVLATTGQRPSQVGRALPADLDFVRRIWFVRAAKGGLGVPFPLNDEALRAWQLFADANAWGPFDSRYFARVLRRHGWPKGVRPYNLRHTFAIDHLLAGTSLGNLQGLMGHSKIETTRTHYAPVLLALLRKTVDNRKLKLA